MKYSTGISVLFVIILAVLAFSTLSSVSDTENRSNAQLGDIEIRNYDTNAQTVDVVVKSNGELEYWTTRAVDGRDGDTVDAAILPADRFSAGPGAYVVSARLGNASTGERLVVSSESDERCYAVQLRIDTDSEIEFLTSAKSYGCDPPRPAPT